MNKCTIDLMRNGERRTVSGSFCHLEIFSGVGPCREKALRRSLSGCRCRRPSLSPRQHNARSISCNSYLGVLVVYWCMQETRFPTRKHHSELQSDTTILRTSPGDEYHCKRRFSCVAYLSLIYLLFAPSYCSCLLLAQARCTSFIRTPRDVGSWRNLLAHPPVFFVKTLPLYFARRHPPRYSLLTRLGVQALELSLRATLGQTP